jgi:hypothetical protein
MSGLLRVLALQGFKWAAQAIQIRETTMSEHFRPRALVLAAACQLILSTSFAQSTERITNGGFEGTPSSMLQPCPTKNDKGETLTPPLIGGAIAPNWLSNNCWLSRPNTKISFALDGASGSPAGGQAQKITTNSPTSDIVLASSFFPLIKGQRYKASVYLKSDIDLEVVLQVRAAGSPYTAYGSRVVKLKANQWTSPSDTQFEGIAPTLDAPRDGALFIVPLGKGTSVDSSIWVDGASVTSEPVAAGEPSTGVTGRPTEVIPSAYFGMHVHRDPKFPSLGRSIGLERFWDAGVYWGGIFPKDPSVPGNVPDWSYFDARVKRAAANGADLIMTLGGHLPDWAVTEASKTTAGCNAYVAGKGLSGPPYIGAANDDAIWRNWVTAVAQHVKDLEAQEGRKLVRYWEIWNEPYQCQLFQDDPARLANLTISASKILHSVFTDFDTAGRKVLSPALDAGEKNFIDRFLDRYTTAMAAPGAKGFDVLAVHAYDFFMGQALDDRTVDGNGQPIDHAGDRLDSAEIMHNAEHLALNLRSVLKRYPALAGIPIWNTEAGYLGSWVSTPDGAGKADDAKGAPFLARNYLLAWGAGFDRNIYYTWDHHREFDDGRQLIMWPLVPGREKVQGDGNYILTDVGVAYEQVARWMTGAILTAQTKNAQGNWQMTLKRGNAQSFVVWNSSPTSAPSSTSTFTSPLSGRTTVTDIHGKTTLVSGPIPVSTSPMFIANPSTKVVISASPTSIKLGQSVALKATVSGGTGVPKGWIQFKANGVNLGAPVLLDASRAASLSTTQLPSGYVGITADYSGDTANSPDSTQLAFIEIVKP